ncbi:MAG: hypothetical protein QOH09_3196 [Pseudonocardiales bacterium]|nr:hypothetical protein [Pseudonocardiales bacterium]MDT7717204.1 hypothetical protein [Pseudonocardiales bacterium]
MPLVAWVTLVLVAVVVAIVGLSLLKVISQLKHVSWTLGAVIVGVNAIAYQTRTVPEVLPSVNANLAPVRAMAEQV